jgi:hypothetical protein
MRFKPRPILKHYVVITQGGSSQDDAGNDTENCQLIGIYSAENSSKALAQAINDNKERGHSFDEDDLIIYETTNIKRL